MSAYMAQTLNGRLSCEHCNAPTPAITYNTNTSSSQGSADVLSANDMRAMGIGPHFHIGFTSVVQRRYRGQPSLKKRQSFRNNCVKWKSKCCHHKDDATGIEIGAERDGKGVSNPNTTYVSVRDCMNRVADLA